MYRVQGVGQVMPPLQHPRALRWLAAHLLSNAAGLFSVNKFRHVLRSQGIPIDGRATFWQGVHASDR